MSSFRTPKGCVVKWVELHAKGEHVDLSMDCGGGGRGSFPSPDGGTSNYPKARVKGVRRVHVPGTSVSIGGNFMGNWGHLPDVGVVRLDFVLSPRHVTCRKKEKDTELSCVIHDGKTVLSGGRRKR